MKRYRRLEVGERLDVGDFYTAKSNPQPPESTSGLLEVQSEEHYMFNTLIESHHGCNYYRPFVFIAKRLVRKYCLVRSNEPIQMFDWFMLRVHYIEAGPWPAPNIEFNNGWTQIIPDYMEHLLDGNETNRRDFVFARFVDCIPISKH